MEDSQMWALIVGFFLPLGISVLEQPKWPDWARAVMAFIICGLAGAVTAYLAGDFTGKDIVTIVLLVLVTAIATYRNWWKPVRIAPEIERLTSPK